MAYIRYRIEGQGAPQAFVWNRKGGHKKLKVLTILEQRSDLQPSDGWMLEKEREEKNKICPPDFSSWPELFPL